MTSDQPLTVLPALSPDDTAFHGAFTMLPSVSRHDRSGSISPSGSGGGTGSGGLMLLNPVIGLRAYYPATEEFYESVRSGHLERPLSGAGGRGTQSVSRTARWMPLKDLSKACGTRRLPFSSRKLPIRWKAIFAIEQTPERFRAHSDYADMKELLGDLAGSDAVICIKQARFELTGEL
jgi:hypothetical protein